MHVEWKQGEFRYLSGMSCLSIIHSISQSVGVLEICRSIQNVHFQINPPTYMHTFIHAYIRTYSALGSAQSYFCVAQGTSYISYSKFLLMLMSVLIKIVRNCLFINWLLVNPGNQFNPYSQLNPAYPEIR